MFFEDMFVNKEKMAKNVNISDSCQIEPTNMFLEVSFAATIQKNKIVPTTAPNCYIIIIPNNPDSCQIVNVFIFC